MIKNYEGYSDPTAAAALRKIRSEEKRRERMLKREAEQYLSREHTEFRTKSVMEDKGTRI